MRLFSAAILGIVSSASAYEETSPFEKARAVLEINCVECHTPEEAKGGLIMSTAKDFLETGDSGKALVGGDPKASGIFTRITLEADDSDRMPPKKHGEPLSAEDIASLKNWIESGAEWPEGETLRPRARTALPKWDAPADPAIVSIEAFPKEISLETSADFHRVIVIARMKDASTHDITRQSKLTLADGKTAALEENLLTPKEDGETKLKIDYRGSPPRSQ